MSDSITITDSAKTQIGKICANNKQQYVRLAIEAGGCSGFNKVWSFDTVLTADDTTYQCNNSSILLIDSMSLEILNNCTIDYKDDLIGSYFSVEVPHAASNCGCGTSFSL